MLTGIQWLMIEWDMWAYSQGRAEWLDKELKRILLVYGYSE